MITPMLPNQPECGSPCSTCEALAHEAGRLREENKALRADVARLLTAIDEAIRDCENWNRHAAIGTLRAALADLKPTPLK